MSEEYCKTFEKQDYRRIMKEPMSTSAILYSIADVRSSPTIVGISRPWRSASPSFRNSSPSFWIGFFDRDFHHERVNRESITLISEKKSDISKRNSLIPPLHMSSSFFRFLSPLVLFSPMPIPSQERGGSNYANCQERAKLTIKDIFGKISDDQYFFNAFAWLY